MITVEDIRKKVIAWPNDKPVEQLLEEIFLMYKVQKGMDESNKGKGIPLNEFKQQLDVWWKSK